jgi:hypothetical protein
MVNFLAMQDIHLCHINSILWLYHESGQTIHIKWVRLDSYKTLLTTLAVGCFWSADTFPIYWNLAIVFSSDAEFQDWLHKSRIEKVRKDPKKVLWTLWISSKSSNRVGARIKRVNVGELLKNTLLLSKCMWNTVSHLSLTVLFLFLVHNLHGFQMLSR